MGGGNRAMTPRSRGRCWRTGTCKAILPTCRRPAAPAYEPRIPPHRRARAAAALTASSSSSGGTHGAPPRLASLSDRQQNVDETSRYRHAATTVGVVK